MGSDFVKNFFAKLSHNRVNHLLAQKPDYQPVGQAYDLGTPVAEASCHAVAVGAIGLGDGNMAILDGNGIDAAIRGGNGKFLIDPKIYGFQDFSLAGDFRIPGRICWQEQKNTESQTYCQNNSQQQNPCFSTHG